MADEKQVQAEEPTDEVVVEDTSDEAVELVDDTPEADRNKKPAKTPIGDPDEAELAEYSESVQKRIKQLSKARHDERRAKEDAQRDKDETLRIAQAIVKENEALKQRLAKGETALAGSLTSAAVAELTSAKKELKEAMEAYDADRIVEAQEKLNRAVLRAEQTRQFQARAQRPQAPRQEQQAPAQPQQAPEPKVDPRARDWQEENKWFGNDHEMTAFALGLHQRLTEEHGPAYATTDEYYERINARMREKFPESFGEQGTQPKTQQRPAGTVVAPATRSTPPKKIVLTNRQADIARRLGVPLKVYAQKLAELENQNG